MKEHARCTAPVDPSSPSRLCMGLYPVQFKEVQAEVCAEDGTVKTPARVDLFISCPSHGNRGVQPAEFINPE